MPHQCVRCNTFYDDGASEILYGCKCGGKLFLYVKKENLEKAKEITTKLSDKEKREIEKDVHDLVGKDISEEEPVVLDIESIRIVKPGKYELDLVHLFKQEPLIYKLEEGKYVIDLIRSFRSPKKKLRKAK